MRQYNTPTADEIGIIMVEDGTDAERTTRDIVVKKIADPLQRISILHPSYIPMHYVLLFPNGQDGWHPNIALVSFDYDCNAKFFVKNSKSEEEVVHRRGGLKRVSLIQFYAFNLHVRNDEHIFHVGRLFQQFIVDGYACTKENRFNFIRHNQVNLCVDIYKGAQDALDQGDIDASQIGQKLILPLSFSGGPRQMVQLYQDAMAIVRNFSKPDLFMTFTCNLKWEEITHEFFPSQTTSNRPNFVSRVLHLKLKELLNDLEKGLLGTLVAKVWVVEFQKHSLPRVHMLLIFDDQSKLWTLEDIDNMVCVEIFYCNTYTKFLW